MFNINIQKFLNICMHVYAYLYMHNKYTQHTHMYYVNTFFNCDNNIKYYEMA